MSQEFSAELFARCGLNCRICVGFFGYTIEGKKQLPCGGCQTMEKTCTFFEKNCKNHRQKAKNDYCFDCADFPCENLKKIDQDYSKKYGPSIIGNFVFIKTYGMDAFLKNEKEKWKCPVCGGVFCVHTKRCYTCNP